MFLVSQGFSVLGFGLVEKCFHRNHDTTPKP